MKTFSAALLACAVLTTGCANRDAIYANPPAELVDQIDTLMPAAEQFVQASQAEALANGIPLTVRQLEIAQRIGLKHPEKVRLYYADQLPAPADPTLAQIARRFGYSDPRMRGYTFGYGIWLKSGVMADEELIAHELIHVRQAEQLGLNQQIRQYLMQLYIYGYNSAPMELEAYRNARNYL